MYTKILVVDDDSYICDLLKTSLEKEGYEVRTAPDGYQAIDVFKKYEPILFSLILCFPVRTVKMFAQSSANLQTSPSL